MALTQGPRFGGDHFEEGKNENNYHYDPIFSGCPIVSFHPPFEDQFESLTCLLPSPHPKNFAKWLHMADGGRLQQ